MSRDVLDVQEIDRSQIAIAGGKGANLGELSRIDGIHLPPGFCVTTAAFQRVLLKTPSIGVLIERFACLKPDNRTLIQELSAEVRQAIEAMPLPADLAGEVIQHLSRLGDHVACAVRSSATAEDLPNASFAGQQDSYLNVIGPEAILRDIRRCWGSLFTERAVTYRMQNGIDHRNAQMAIIVQQMVFPQVSGVLFTADPISGNRTIATVEASFGLGEALVSGLVNADVYAVREGEIISRTISAKQRAIVPGPSGGTEVHAIDPIRREHPALTDAQVVRIARQGRMIEAHFGHPQDIEWCLAEDDLQIVQSRPITTLFPIPNATDGENHVYLSVGHQQMMTDAMKPLGISLWQLTAAAPMHEAGGRLFVDVTRQLASPGSRDGFLAMIGKGDPLFEQGLRRVLEREHFIHMLPEESHAPSPLGAPTAPIDVDPSIVDALIERSQASIATLKRDIQGKTGEELMAFIRDDLNELKRILFDRQSHQVFMTAMEASWWLNEHIEQWLGEKNAVDTLTQSVPNNVTSEMGLALLDVADAIRPHRDVIARLEAPDLDGFLDELPGIAGGQEARDAIKVWLDMYGMRCAGEIDVTRPRWSERPDMLVPVILSNIRSFGPGERRRRYEQGLQEARHKEAALLESLRALPDGDQNANETKQMIDRVRTFIGYREYPKYGMISRYGVYKQALMGEAERLAQTGVIQDAEEIFFLTFDELATVTRTQEIDFRLIQQREEAFKAYQALRPPRVLTSDGEAISGEYRNTDAPAGALIGLPVSTGTVEGRARVMLDMADAALEPGDILVTVFTDPSWTPLFVGIAGLVTEVGGQMTHGAVIAREYGLPAVVGVPDATRLIQDGQTIRVNGAAGFVEIVSNPYEPAEHWLERPRR